MELLGAFGKETAPDGTTGKEPKPPPECLELALKISEPEPEDTKEPQGVDVHDQATRLRQQMC